MRKTYIFFLAALFLVEAAAYHVPREACEVGLEGHLWVSLTYLYHRHPDLPRL